MIIDQNEIIARNAGVLNPIYTPGGVTSGAAPAGATWLTRKDYVDAKAKERMGGAIAAGAVWITPDNPVTEFGQSYFRQGALIEFPAGRFTGTPRVVVSVNTEAPGIVIGVGAVNAYAGGFTAVLTRKSQTSTLVTWIAVQATE